MHSATLLEIFRVCLLGGLPRGALNGATSPAADVIRPHAHIPVSPYHRPNFRIADDPPEHCPNPFADVSYAVRYDLRHCSLTMSEKSGFDPHDNDGPRTLRDPKERERRKAMLTLPHIAPLADYTAELRGRGGVEVPEFDPLDGGVDAQVLFLFEKPGPMTAEAGRRAGSGFISRNNDDPTAEATFKFMRQAGIPRKATVIWNIVPWWNGTRKIFADEIRDGAASFISLRGRLTNLSAVVMVGEKAARLQPYLTTTDLELFRSLHPGPLVRARFRSKWEAIPSQWSKVLDIVRGTK